MKRIPISILAAAFVCVGLTLAIPDLQQDVDRHSDTPAPIVELTVSRDSVAGWNVYAKVDHFRFAHENVNRAPRPGEGHAHLLVDGHKVARMYQGAYHLGVLAPGEHVVSVSLHGNDHSSSYAHGKPIVDSVSITVPAPQQADAQHHGHHAHDAGVEVGASFEVPQINLAVVPDSEMGWNVLADVRGFRFAPESVGGQPVRGEGHAHLYVDGRKVARMYGGAHHLPALAPGDHEVRITLNANNHAAFTDNGKEIAAITTVHVAGATAQGSTRAAVD